MFRLERRLTALKFTKYMDSPLFGYVFRDEDKPSPKEILQKLQDDSYASLYDFILDVRSMVVSAKKRLKDEPKEFIIVSDYSQRFEKSFVKIARTPEQLAIQAIKRQHNKMTNIRRAMTLAAFDPNLPEMAAEHRKPRLQKPTASKIAELQRAIESTTDVRVLAAIARILKRHIPQFELKETTVIDVQSITPECTEELADLLLHK